MSDQFYKPRPIAPEDNKQMIGLRWSLRVSVAGWIIYGAFAYAFADVGIIPAWVQSAMVILGSVLIVAGAESNTIATTEAALSKLGTDRISTWDFAAVGASILGGICTPLITFSTRQPELAGTWWRQAAVKSGPLILGVAGVLDFYGAVTELALAKRDHVRALGDYLEEKRQHDEANGIVQRKPLPQATIKEYRGWIVGMNGETPRTVEALTELCHEHEHEPPPSDSTVRRWLKLGRGE